MDHRWLVGLPSAREATQTKGSVATLPAMSDSDGPTPPSNPGHVATEDDLRDLVVEGYHPPQQFRTVETTSRIVVAAWELMATQPRTPLRVDDVLARSGIAGSSFYARFDGSDPLVEVCGLLALAAERRAREGCVAPPATVTASTDELVAPLLDPGLLPREVLAVGAWSEAYVEARQRDAVAEVTWRAGAAMDGRGPDEPVDTYRRLVTWFQLTRAQVDILAALGPLALEAEALGVRTRLRVALGARLFGEPHLAGSTGTAAAGGGIASERRAVRARSDRGAAAVAELRRATREVLIARGRALTPGEVAASVHRSRSAFFDAFGSVGAALADLARAEQLARIPTELFRPRADLRPDQLIAHLAHRLHAWQAHQGIAGRRLLQVAAEHPPLAVELLAQVEDSVSLLTGWYGTWLDLPEAEAHAAFGALLLLHQHAVVWGTPAPAATSAEALSLLFDPLVA